MFMLRGIPFVDLAYLHKRDLQGNVLSYRRRKTGRALTVSLTPEAMQMVRMVANRNPDSPYLFPILPVSYTHLANMEEKMADPDFRGDTQLLLHPNEPFNPLAGYEIVKEKLIDMI